LFLLFLLRSASYSSTLECLLTGGEDVARDVTAAAAAEKRLALGGALLLPRSSSISDEDFFSVQRRTWYREGRSP
jgi:hypothetical protein